MIDRPFDPGLQPERTLLAWRRTALSLAVGSAVGVRLALPAFGGLAVLAGVVGLGLSLAAYLNAARRYRRTHLELVSAVSPRLGGAASLALLTAACLMLGLLALAYVLLVAARPTASLVG